MAILIPQNGGCRTAICRTGFCSCPDDGRKGNSERNAKNMTAPIQQPQDVSLRWTAETVGMSWDILDRMERAVAKVRERLLRATAALNQAGVPYAGPLKRPPELTPSQTAAPTDRSQGCGFVTPSAFSSLPARNGCVHPG